MKPTEKDIQNHILAYLKARRVFAWQVDSVGIYDQARGVYRSNKNKLKGVSDIIGIFKGRPLAIEVKVDTLKDHKGTTLRNKGYPTKEQKEFLQKFSDEGGIAFIARSVEDVEEQLNTFMRL
jgi:penicillin-binding protein-related factor A (putative recombinase)